MKTGGAPGVHQVCTKASSSYYTHRHNGALVFLLFLALNITYIQATDTCLFSPSFHFSCCSQVQIILLVVLRLNLILVSLIMTFLCCIRDPHPILARCSDLYCTPARNNCDLVVIEHVRIICHTYTYIHTYTLIILNGNLMLILLVSTTMTWTIHHWLLHMQPEMLRACEQLYDCVLK